MPKEKIVSYQINVEATTSGTEVELVGFADKGIIRQIVIARTSGSGTTLDLQIRNTSGSSRITNLYYSNPTMTLPESIDSNFEALFDFSSNNRTPYLFAEVDSDSEITVRIDMELIG